ncbi:MAG: hypothetical protein WAQ98_03165, partial [Blastocatellia bacterium]
MACKQQKPTTGLEFLLQATKTNRFTEGRLSKGFNYSKLQRPNKEKDKKSYIDEDPFLLTKNNSRGAGESKNSLLSEAALTIY